MATQNNVSDVQVEGFLLDIDGQDMTWEEVKLELMSAVSELASQIQSEIHRYELPDDDIGHTYGS